MGNDYVAKAVEWVTRPDTFFADMADLNDEILSWLGTHEELNPNYLPPEALPEGYILSDEERARNNQKFGWEIDRLKRPDRKSPLAVKLRVYALAAAVAADENPGEFHYPPKLLESLRDVVIKADWPKLNDVCNAHDEAVGKHRARLKFRKLAPDGAIVETPPAAPANLKAPERKHFQIYALKNFCGWGLSEERTLSQFGVTQGTLSRWCQKVERFLKAGGHSPDFREIVQGIAVVDPAALEMGQNTEGRTPRQRNRKTSD